MFGFRPLPDGTCKTKATKINHGQWEIDGHNFLSYAVRRPRWLFDVQSVNLGHGTGMWGSSRRERQRMPRWKRMRTASQQRMRGVWVWSSSELSTSKWSASKWSENDLNGPECLMNASISKLLCLPVDLSICLASWPSKLLCQTISPCECAQYMFIMHVQSCPCGIFSSISYFLCLFPGLFIYRSAFLPRT